MWSAKCTYLSQVGNIYGELTSQPVEPIIVKFFGIFFLFFQSSSIWGNLISSAVLGLKEDGANETEIVSAPDLSKCGIHYCPAPAVVANDTDEGPEIEDEDNFSASRYQLFILAGVYLACSI